MSTHVLGRLLLATALLGTVGSTLGAYPHQLAYFNETAGGPERGWQQMLGSSVDWGQDLLFVRDWLELQQVNELAVRIKSTNSRWYPAGQLVLPLEVNAASWTIMSVGDAELQEGTTPHMPVHPIGFTLIAVNKSRVASSSRQQEQVRNKRLEHKN